MIILFVMAKNNFLSFFKLVEINVPGLPESEVK